MDAEHLNLVHTFSKMSVFSIILPHVDEIFLTRRFSDNFPAAQTFGGSKIASSFPYHDFHLSKVDKIGF